MLGSSALYGHWGFGSGRLPCQGPVVAQMSLSQKGYDFGILMPEEVALVMRVYRRITVEPWISREAADLEAFGRYVLCMYQRGMCDEERLFQICTVAARRKFGRRAAEQVPPGGTAKERSSLIDEQAAEPANRS